MAPNPARILVIEDDDNLRSVLAKLLAGKGREIITAREPLVCPVYLAGPCDCPPGMVCGDVLVTDFNMPRMDGLTFIENQLRNGCRGSCENKAVFTGAVSVVDRLKSAALGCELFQKPNDLDRLLAWVDRRLAAVPPDRILRPLGEANCSHRAVR